VSCRTGLLLLFRVLILHGRGSGQIQFGLLGGFLQSLGFSLGIHRKNGGILSRCLHRHESLAKVFGRHGSILGLSVHLLLLAAAATKTSLLLLFRRRAHATSIGFGLVGIAPQFVGFLRQSDVRCRRLARDFLGGLGLLFQVFDVRLEVGLLVLRDHGGLLVLRVPQPRDVCHII